MTIRTAAIMARGLGTRMRRVETDTSSAPRPTVSASQAAVAETGVKGMIPIGGDGPAGRPPRPFLDYVLSSLADVGVTRVVLVLAPSPEHDNLRDYFTMVSPPQRLRVVFAEQQLPNGTANAVIAAAEIVGDEPFLVLNADNYYPHDALQALVNATSAATIAFDRDTLIHGSNIDAARVGSFAVLDVAPDGRLRGIIEKPGNTMDITSDTARWVGMNCWVVTPDIVDACKRVPCSSRGEFELPEAVALAIREGVAVHAERLAAPVLDLSRRADIAVVAAQLAAVEPHP